MTNKPKEEMIVRLKPCPFCGDKELDQKWKVGNPNRVYCMKCGSCGPVEYNEKNASWNTRDDQLRPLLDEAVEALRKVAKQEIKDIPYEQGENKMNKKAVLVTTEFRGVFFGYVKDDKKLPEKITLTKARNCIYWSSDVRGFLGLASSGPSNSCKIGAEVSELTLWKITSVTPVTSEAEGKWTK